jgi:alpha/beta superfamily hydrolase
LTASSYDGLKMEEKISVESGRYRLEGYWQAGAANKGAVITHPHPLYGGSMSNPVVETIQNAYQQNGYATLRFNFRGVGGSQGSYDNGAGEKDDVYAAVATLKSGGTTAIDLAGYSFGAWVNAAIVADSRTPIEMTSPPFIAFVRCCRPGTRMRSLKLSTAAIIFISVVWKNCSPF